MDIQEISKFVESGYEKLSSHDSVGACENWLIAWAGLKTYMDEKRIKDIFELNDRKYFVGYMIPGNMVRDFGWELLNAGLKDQKYYHKCIEYGEEIIGYFGDDNEAKEEIRRSIAESYFRVGEEEKSDMLYNEWLEADSKWGWGYLEWAHQYEYGREGETGDKEKASGIYERVLEINDVRDRIDVVDSALSFYEKTDERAKVERLRDELTQLQAMFPDHRTNNPRVSSHKTGRNDPCPCGSGKKYKKCHGVIGAE
jgi:tetratricopeptide (TPR) repeat protein